MENVVIHTKGSKNKGISKAYTCLNEKCLKINHRFEEIYIWSHALVVENLPINCEAIIETNPEFGWGGKANCITAANSNKGINATSSDVKIIDHTIHAGRESWEGAAIGKQDIEDKERLILLNKIKENLLSYKKDDKPKKV